MRIYQKGTKVVIDGEGRTYLHDNSHSYFVLLESDNIDIEFTNFVIKSKGKPKRKSKQRHIVRSFRKGILALALILGLSLCAFSQDTARLKSSKQQYSLYDKNNVKELQGKYELLMYKEGEQKILEVNNLTNQTNKRKFKVNQRVEEFQEGDSVLLSWNTVLATPPYTEGGVRILFKGEDIIIIGVLNPWSVTLYFIDLPENKL